MVKWVKHGAKIELPFLKDIDWIERFDLVKWVKHAAKEKLPFLGDNDCTEKKV